MMKVEAVRQVGWIRQMVGMVCLTGAVLAGGCARAEAAPSLPDSYPSRNALVQAVLDALENGDRSALERARVTREQYETLLWPYLPESNSLTFEFAWDLNERNSTKALARAIENFEGVRFALEDVQFTEPVEEYPGFKLYLGARVIATRLSDGRRGELPVLDAMVEMNGRWKLLNFAD